MLTPHRLTLAVVSAIFLFGAAPLQGAQEQTASQFYLAYRDVFAKATKIDELFPYMSKATLSRIESTPADERAEMFEMVKELNTYTDVKVVKESTTPEGITLTVEGIDSDKAKATGTIEIVKEDGKWKVGRERWSSSF